MLEYRQLGQSDLRVSEICLGTMTWGQQNDEAEGHAQMDAALDDGVNFFDTAEMYPIPPRAPTQGATERIIGSWFQQRKNRDKIILASKVTGRSTMDWLRDDGAPCEQSRKQILEALDKSLARLRTDYIDLYQLHWPDRPMRGFGGTLTYKHWTGESHPIEEILQTLQECVKAGKIRYIGLSNETAWGMMAFLHESITKNLPRVQSIQNPYNLLNRCFDLGCAEISMREQVSLLAYSPLAQGYLTGKYQNGALPQGSRKQLFQRLQRYEVAGSEELIDKYLAVAQKYGLDPAQMAIRFVSARKFLTSNIIGARTMAQLKTALASREIAWDRAIEDDINAIHRRTPNLCP